MEILPALISSEEYENYHPGTVEVSSKGQKHWHGLLFTRYSYPKQSPGSPRPATTDHILAFPDSGAVRGSYSFNDSKWKPYIWRQREWFIGQAFRNGYDLSWDALCNDNTDFSVCYLHLSPKFLETVILEAGGQSAGEIEIPHQLGISDPLMLQIGLALQSEAEYPNLYGKIFVETAAHFLATHLLKNYCSGRHKIPEVKGKSHVKTCKKVIEYIHSRLDKELSLKAIANIANMSPYHFAHVFKKTMGVAPHRYIMKRRIERAKELLTDTSLPVNLIALEVGYTSCHFIRIFKQLVGIPPNMYRKTT